MQCRERNYELGCIPESSIQKASDPLAKSLRNLFGSVSHDAGKWENRERRRKEQEERAIGGKDLKADCHRNKEQEPLHASLDAPRSSQSTQSTVWVSR